MVLPSAQLAIIIGLEPALRRKESSARGERRADGKIHWMEVDGMLWMEPLQSMTRSYVK